MKSNEGARVAHLVQYLRVGGLERMAASLAEQAPALGMHAVMIGYLGEGPFRAAVERRGVPTAMIPTPAGLSPRLPLKLASWLRRERIDVLHTHHVGPFLYGAAAATLAGCAHVHTEHSHELYDVPRRRAIGASIGRVARAVAVTPEVAAFHKQHLGSELDVVANGVSAPRRVVHVEARAEARALLGLVPGRPVVGCVARLSREKGHLLLLEAFAQKRLQAHLVLVGDGAMEPELRARARSLGIADLVRFTGALDEPERVMPALDVVALASEREGLPMALLEAMAHGIPIVATAVGGVPELLEGGAGVLVAPGDARALGTALEVLLRERGARLAFGQRGRARVIARYSAEHMASRYAEIYAEELEKRCGVIHVIAPGPLAGAERVVLAGSAALRDLGMSVEILAIREARAPEHASALVAEAKRLGVPARSVTARGRADPAADRKFEPRKSVAGGPPVAAAGSPNA